MHFFNIGVTTISNLLSKNLKNYLYSEPELVFVSFSVAAQDQGMRLFYLKFSVTVTELTLVLVKEFF
jgi:hypothetical protein